MIHEDTYADLSSMKERERKTIGIPISYDDIFREIILKTDRYLRIEEPVRQYLEAYIGKISTFEFVRGAILFGSIAKGTDNEYSDIDLFIPVSNTLIEAYSLCSSALRSLDQMRKETVIAAGRHHYVSPLVVQMDELKRIDPIFFDVVDYGITLFDRYGTIRDFVNGVHSTSYKRTSESSGEVIRWN